MKYNSFKKEERLKKTSEIERLRETGKKIFGKFYVLIYAANKLESNRIGILVSKRNRGAIERNYERRIIREIFRNNKEIFKTKMDMLIIKNKNDNAVFQQKKDDLEKLFQNCQY